MTEHLLYLVEDMYMGGSSRVISDLTDEMVDRGYQVTIGVLVGEEEDVGMRPTARGVEFVFFGEGKGKGRRIDVFIRLVYRLRKWVRERGITLVHAHKTLAVLTARTALGGVGGWGGVPVVCTSHGCSDGPALVSRWVRVLQRGSYFNSSVSYNARKALVAAGSYSSDALHVIYNGIDFSVYERPKELPTKVHDPYIWLYVGRLAPEKDLFTLIKAMRRLVDRGANVRLQIVGDGELGGDVAKEIRRLGLAAYVEMLGNRRDIPQLMHHADALVLSSLTEGLPMVLIEAMGARLPIVSTICGGTSEMVKGHGWLVEPKRADRLADVMFKAMLMTGEERETMINEAYRFARRHFDHKRIGDKWERIYRYVREEGVVTSTRAKELLTEEAWEE